MKTVTYCQNCQKLLPHYQRALSKFCSVECKNAFWATHRRAERAQKRAKMALAELIEIGKQSDYLYQITRDAIESACEDANKLISSSLWVCSECGQLRYDKPVMGDTCPFCKGDVFIAMKQ